MKKPFVHLHNHTEYSLLDGAVRISDLVKKAVEFNMPAVAITDHGVMYGVINFYKECKKAGINPIIGCEVYLAPGSRFSKSGRQDSRNYHLVLLAENNQGYRNLSNLVTRSFLDGFYYKPRIDFELLEQYSDGLIALSSCLQGLVPRAISEEGMDEAANYIKRMQEILGKENFYLEIQDHGLKEQKQLNPAIIELSRKTGAPLVATNDVHYLEKSHSRLHEILLHIQTGTTIRDELKIGFSTEEFYFKSPDEMYEIFADTPEALTNTLEIAERCQVEFDFGRVILPEYEVPEGYDLDSYLAELCWQGVRRRYAEVTPEVEERLNYELEVIKKMGFSGYFLIVWDVINWAKNNGIRVGPGRGSAAGSLVAYVLGISDIDPLRFNLYFERFLNPSRMSMPDIDIDFAEDRREEVINYVRQKYGEDHVAQIITFSTMKARAATRDAGRVLDFPYSYVDKIAKLITFPTIDESLEQVKELREMYNNDANARQIIDAARGIEGLVRQDSIHAAGVVISREPLANIVPLQKKGEDSEVVTQYDMKPISELGLLKMDFLGLRTLTVIENTLSLIKERHGEAPDLSNLPLDDKDTFELLSRGETIGVFQLERPFMREMLKELKPTAFEDIIAANALNRPGPIKSGMVQDFINRKHGKQKITYPHPLLKEALSETYGTIVYQEQVMQIARALAGFTMEEADTLRQAISKKIPGQLEAAREKFIEGSVANGVDRKLAEDIFSAIMNFAEYAFNKSHSAAYALVSYQTAWLKAHYPVEFLTALLTSVKDDQDKVALYVNEARRMGIEVLLPDVNKSQAGFYPEGERAIRYGLATVRNVGEAAAEAIIAARQKKKFTSFYDFCLRVDSSVLNKRILESLIKVQAFASLNHTVKDLLESYSVILEQALKHRQMEMMGQFSLFGNEEEDKSREEMLLASSTGQEYPQDVLLRFEKEYLGAYISRHPVLDLQPVFEQKCSHTTSELAEAGDAAEVTVGGIITAVKTTTTRKGDLSALVTLEDLEGQITVRVWPNTFEKHRETLVPDRIVIIKGKVDQRDEGQEPILIADSIHLPDENIETSHKPRYTPKEFHIFLDVGRVVNNNGVIHQLKELLKQHPGKDTVFIHLTSEKGEKVLRLGDEFRVRANEAVKLKCEQYFDAKIRIQRSSKNGLHGTENNKVAGRKAGPN